MKLLATLCFVLAVFVAGTADADGQKKWKKWNKKPTRTQPGPAIPEPTSALLFGAGIAATMAASRRRPAH